VLEIKQSKNVTASFATPTEESARIAIFGGFGHATVTVFSRRRISAERAREQRTRRWKTLSARTTKAEAAHWLVDRGTPNPPNSAG
jgi:hypothetical protein